MNKLLPLALLGLTCAPQRTERRAVWTVASFVHRYDAGVDFGGWSPRELISAPGEAIPFRSGAFSLDGGDELMISDGGGGFGLTVFPGYSAGAPVAYTITDIWYHTPQPWVQPTYLGLGRTVFPVDVSGSFYSPFWRKELVSPPFPATSATEVLNHLAQPDGGTMVEGDIILCPLVPPRTTMARAAKDPFPVHPFTGQQVAVGTFPSAAESLDPLPAWVDGHDTSYLSFGSWRAQAQGDTLIASRFFVFGRQVNGAFEGLPVPAVLPDDALHDALMQRVEVTLAPGTVAFLPASRAALGPALAARGVPLALHALPEKAPRDGGAVLGTLEDGGVGPALGVVSGAQLLAVDPAIDEVTGGRYMLRLALDEKCFLPGGGFPDACIWLDSAGQIGEWVADAQLNPEDVTLSVGQLLQVTP
jgi:hypothetical protein